MTGPGMSTRTPEEKMRRLAELRDPNSCMFKSVESYITTRKRAIDEEKRSQGLTVAVPCNPGVEGVRRLEKIFGWRFTTMDKRTVMPPFMHAYVHCMNRLTAQIKSYDSEEVLEFDADLVSMAVRLQAHKHVCMTFANSVVAAQYHRDVALLKKAMCSRVPHIRVNAHALYAQIVARGGPNLCFDARGCNRIVDSVLFDPTRVEVSAVQAAAVINQHQAARGKGWLWFETEMLVSDYGQLTGVPGKYLIDRGADRIYIIPEDGQTAAASYPFSWTMSFVLEAEVVYDGVRYLIEKHDSKPGTIGWIMVRMDACFDNDATYETKYHYPMEEPMVVVQQIMHIPKLARRTNRKELVRSVHSQSLVDKVMARLSRMSADKLTLHEARLAVQDYASQEVTRGTFVQVPRVMPFDLPETLARGLWKKAMWNRACMEAEGKEALRRVDRDYKASAKAWASGIVTYASRVGVSYYSAITQLPDAMMRDGFSLEEQLVTITPLHTSEVVQNVVRTDPRVQDYGRMNASLPGGARAGRSSVTSSEGSVKRAMDRAGAYEACKALDETFDVSGRSCSSESEGGVELVHEREHEPSPRKMSDEREMLVDKMRDAYGAVDVRLSPRNESVVAAPRMPQTSEIEPVADSASVIRDSYAEVWRVFDGHNFQKRAHLASTGDQVLSYWVSYMRVNASRNTMASKNDVWLSHWNTSAAGKQPTTQWCMLYAFNKRVLNAPRCNVPCVIEERLRDDFERFASVAFRENWKEVVVRRTAQAAWQPRVSEIRRNVAKLDTSKVTRMLQEAFSVGKIDMQSWKAMVKTLAKPKVNASAATAVLPTQTIVYQESKMTNSYFSSILSEAHDTLDELLRPNVLINVRRDFDGFERWYNSMHVRRKTAGAALRRYESDISQCDKSHTMYNLLLYFYTLEQLGIPDDLCALWRVVVGVKRVSAPMLGVVLEYFEQLASGAWCTISVNSIVVAIANIVAKNVSREGLVCASYVGDDAFEEVNRPVEMATSVERFRDYFNLEAKTFEVSDVYFCGKYFVEYDGYHFMVKDPLKAAETGGRSINTKVSHNELYQSFKDDMHHYEKKEVMDRLALVVQKRMGLAEAPYALIRGLSTAVMNEDQFLSRYKEKTTLEA